MSDESDRRQNIRREDDARVSMWRGQISEQVRAHEARFAELNGDIRDLATKTENLGTAITEARTELREAREDIADAAKQVRKTRDQELSLLRSDIHDAKVTTRDLLLTVALPIVVLIIGAIIVAHGKVI